MPGEISLVGLSRFLELMPVFLHDSQVQPGVVVLRIERERLPQPFHGCFLITETVVSQGMMICGAGSIGCEIRRIDRGELFLRVAEPPESEQTDSVIETGLVIHMVKSERTFESRQRSSRLVTHQQSDPAKILTVGGGRRFSADRGQGAEGAVVIASSEIQRRRIASLQRLRCLGGAG